MNPGRDLLLLLLILSVPALPARGWLGAPSLGPPHARPGCASPVEVAGVGVACVGEAAAHAGLRAGDRLTLASGRDARRPRVLRGRMAPERLAALGVVLDLNRAALAELASLDGIGPRLAERIAAGRPFASVDDLARVRGVGERRLASLRPRLYVPNSPGNL
jgi:hypothetical protein